MFDCHGKESKRKGHTDRIAMSAEGETSENRGIL